VGADAIIGPIIGGPVPQSDILPVQGTGPADNPHSIF